MASHQGGQPAWFAPAMEHFLAPIRANLARLQDDVTTIRDEVETIRDEVETIKNKVATLQADVGHIRRLAAIVELSLCPLPGFPTDQMQTWNRGCGSSLDAPLQVVPFGNGEDPTTGEVIFLNSCLRITCLTSSNPAQSPGS